MDALRKFLVEAGTPSTDILSVVVEIELQSPLPIGSNHDYFITGEGMLSGLIRAWPLPSFASIDS